MNHVESALSKNIAKQSEILFSEKVNSENQGIKELLIKKLSECLVSGTIWGSFRKFRPDAVDILLRGKQKILLIINVIENNAIIFLRPISTSKNKIFVKVNHCVLMLKTFYNPSLINFMIS